MRERIAETLGDVFWSDLRAHAERDALILVADDLDLVDVGMALATNDAPAVEAWIQGGKLTKPTAEDLVRWPLEVGLGFSSVIVQPFVLIRRPAAPTLS
jgi:hypothetical protein